ncbi:MAG: oligosaccharide flippase family protein [Terracidiphilus sp.]|jgi:O-antigen/teichoic acid export membrane protein
MGEIILMVQQLTRMVRIGPFELSTAEGRSIERYRRAAMTTLSAVISKGAAFLTLFISVPLTLSYLGAERFGLWMTIGSVTVILSSSDLGIGYGLLCCVAEANGKDDRELARGYVSSAFFMLAGIAASFLCAFFAVYELIPWPRLFNVHSPTAVAEAGPAAAVFVCCFIASIPLGIVNRIQIGYQDGFENNLWISLGSVFSLAAVLLACYVRASLPWLVLAMTGAPILAVILNSTVLFAVERPWLCPQWSLANTRMQNRMLGLGSMFVILQLAAAIGFSSDNVVIAQNLGSAAVTQYSVPARMFSLITMVIITVISPLWPAYGEALARRDFDWVRRALKRSMEISLLIGLSANLLLVALAPRILRWWIGTKITPSFLLLVSLAIWGVLCAVSTAPTTLLNGAGMLKGQAAAAAVACVVNLGLSIYLTRRIGIAGVCLGSVIAQATIALPAYIYLATQLRRQLAEARIPL